MTVRIHTALLSAALLVGACGGKQEPAPGQQTVQPAMGDGNKTVGGAGAEAARGGADKGAQPPGKQGGPATAPADDLLPGGSPLSAALTPSPEAKVEIVEFSDFQCPFCGRVVETVHQLMKDYGPTVKVTFLHQPLPFHQNARPAALAAEAARAQGKFWEMHDKLFGNQQALTPADFEKYAGEIGLNVDQWKADVASKQIAMTVNTHSAVGTAVGASGTPAFFINGKSLRGAQPIDQFKAIIDAEIKEADTAGKKGEDWIKSRLQANNQQLYDLVYGGKVAPKPQPQKPPVDRTVYKVEILDTDPVKGPPTALITMVLFSDFQCPFCKKLNPTLDQLMKDYDGKIRLLFKQNPLPFHKDAMPAAMAAMCAKEQGKFWEMHDKMFDGQPALDAATLEKYAGEIGIDAGKWKACVAENRYNTQILADQEEAGKVTARGTPNVFINGRKMTGAKPIEEFKELIDEEMKKAQAMVDKGIAPDKLYAEIIKDGKVFEPLEAQVNEFKLDGAPMKGKPTAKIQVVLFSDFQCPFCSRVAPALEDLAKKYGDDIMIAFKNFPLDFHKDAKPTAIAAMCAHEQGKFWEFHNEAFGNQKALSPDDHKAYAQKIGLDMNKFNACVTAGKTAQIDADAEEGRKAGVRGTPTIYINGRKFNSPSGYSVDAFSAVIDKYILGKTPAPPTPPGAPK